jgi:hypothetical protein
MENDGLKSLAIAGLVCGTASWLILGIILAPLGLIFSILAVKSNNSSTKTIAIIGIVISAIAVAVLVFSMAILASLR